ncbi:prostaglandin reductase 1 [Nasonia vitripennis]|uniref:Prostaglandin reductase 1 n=1 Tax=Nasonia vitripennis TaxID=7425 RepID=A0A7M7QSF5_NASVI|nr:prostaglandin reductase 1 [Nasonia vitripennis]XP_032452998.1 prostaglandin reductase 1 [Nasonia vitripennis]XP_032452999.1 prostaglandin reductase 1 [Nasonia vitripennis]
MAGIVKKSLVMLCQHQAVISQLGYQNSRTITTVAKKYVFSKHFSGEPKPTDLKLVEEELPAVKDGEILAEAEYLSVDPYMRAYTVRLPVGRTMIGSQVAKIVESKNPNYPVGKRIVGYMGWRSHTVLNPEKPASKDQIMKDRPYIIPDLGDLSPSLALGVLGMPGNTAYFGFLEICAPKAGETVVISGAAGAVGSHVGQIAKIHGLKAIGIAGSDSKCKWLVDELGFDRAINYKTENIAAALKEAAPDGVDCYFDNVGGDISTTVIYQMREFGRVSICGSISSYNSDSLPKTRILQPAVVFNQLKMEGFIVTRWSDRWLEGIEKNMQWIREGKLKYKETVTEGFENMFQAFHGMLKGENVGKAVVKV